MRLNYRAAMVLGVVLCAACTYDTGGEDTVGAAFEPIIGGTVATAYPEAAYLNIDMTTTGGYACSGTLIAPQVVLTAGHCVDGHSRWEVHVGTAYQVSTSSAVYDWNEHGAETVNPAHHDIGLVFLSTPIKIASYPALSKTKAGDNTKALNVGRVLNGVVQSGAYQAPATLVAADRIGYPFDYTSADVIQPGDSGGPVFLSGTHTILAVNSGAGSSAQVLARVDLLADWLTSQVSAHSGTVPSGSGGASSGGAAGSSSDKAGAANGGAKGSDASKAGAANGGSAGTKASGGSSGGAALTTCLGTKEQELNDSLPAANKLVGSACGELSSTTDVDWFSTSVAPGNHMIEISASGDASMALGIVSGSTCVVSVSAAQRTSLTVSGAAVSVCIRASSASKKTQSYRVSVN